MVHCFFLPCCYRRSNCLQLYRQISLVSRLRQERRDAKLLAAHGEPRPSYLSTREDAVGEEDGHEAHNESLQQIKCHLSQLPKPLSLEQKRNAIQQFEGLAAFVECLNVLEEEAKERGSSTELSPLDPYAVSVALACGVRYLTVDELLGLVDPFRTALSRPLSAEPSQFYYSFAQLYQRAQFPLDAYFYEVLFSKLLRACVPGSLIPLAMAKMLGELAAADSSRVTVYHERCLLRALINAEFSPSDIERQWDKMIQLKAVDFSSLSTYFLWACRKDGHSIDDIKSRLDMVAQEQRVDDSQQDTMSFLEFVIFSYLLKRGRLNDALALFVKCRMDEHVALMQHHGEHFAVALLKAGSWLWEPIRRFFLTYIFHERVVNGTQCVDIRSVVASCPTKKRSLISSILPRILKTDHHMGKSLVTTLKQVDGRPTMAGYHCLLPILLSPFFSEPLKYELLFIYTGVLVRKYDFAFHPESPAATLFSALLSLLPLPELKNALYAFLSHLHSQGLEPDWTSVNLMVHELAAPWAEPIRMPAFSVLLSSKLLGQPSPTKPWLWQWELQADGGSWDARALNTFLLMAREAAEYALISCLLRLLKAQRKAVIFPANLDLVSNEHRIHQSNVRMKGILPHRADLSELEAKMHQLAQGGPAASNSLTESVARLIACLRSRGIATVYDVRQIKSWQWLPLLHSTRGEPVDESLVELAKEAVQEPILSVVKVQWHASKADMKGESSSASLPALGSVVVNKKGLLTRFKYPE